MWPCECDLEVNFLINVIFYACVWTVSLSNIFNFMKDLTVCATAYNPAFYVHLLIPDLRYNIDFGNNDSIKNKKEKPTGQGHGDNCWQQEIDYFACHQ